MTNSTEVKKGNLSVFNWQVEQFSVKGRIDNRSAKFWHFKCMCMEMQDQEREDDYYNLTKHKQ